MMGWGNHGYGMGWFGGIFMILFWGLVIVAIVLVIRHFMGGSGEGSYGQDEHDPLRILQKRYASGEIEKEEYEERKRVLTNGK